MHFLRSMAKAAVIIVIVLVMTSVAIMAIPAQAQYQLQSGKSIPLPAGVTPDVTIYPRCFLSFRPSVIGVSQLLLVNVWLTPSGFEPMRVMGYKITFTKPDGTKEVKTLDAIAADTTSWFEYVPDQAGTWTVKFEMPGAYWPIGNYSQGGIFTQSLYYAPASTAEQQLIVQQELVASWPPAPLPTDYWTRPAHVENREWWSILGNYPATGYVGGGPIWDELYPGTTPQWNDKFEFVPWVQGPTTSHIVWKRQGAVAGLIGGTAYFYGTASNPGDPSVIYAGRCYQTYTKPGVGNVAACYDLRTGEIYYEIPTAQGGVTPSYVAYYPSSTSAASSTWSAELISISSGRLMKVNPFTGALAGNYSIAPLTGSGGIFHNQIGGCVVSVQDLGAAAGVQRYRLLNWTTQGSSTTLAGRIITNTTYAISSIPLAAFGGGAQGYMIDWNVGYRIETTTLTSQPDPFSPRVGTNLKGFSLPTGQMLWDVNTTAIKGSGGMDLCDHGKFAMFTATDESIKPPTKGGYYTCWDLATGKQLWESDLLSYPAGMFGSYNTASGYGMLFRFSYDGVYAIDWDTGKIVWKTSISAWTPFESPYLESEGGNGSYPTGGGIVADGKLYAWNEEHSESWPRTRGWEGFCLNATTGELIWKIIGAPVANGIADGYLTAGSSRDGYMYVFGKGKSATTVTAPDVAVPLGTAFTIKGTVLDQSPGQPGTPCVSKDSMETQMEYLHMQMPIDGLWHNETITGVPVTLTAIASDGSVLDLGSATTSGYYGTFEKAWTPPAEGTYKIIATFASDDSYGSSAAATAVTVGPAPAEVVIPEQPTPPDYTLTLLGGFIAVIVAVALVGMILYRKK